MPCGCNLVGPARDLNVRNTSARAHAKRRIDFGKLVTGDCDNFGKQGLLIFDYMPYGL